MAVSPHVISTVCHHSDSDNSPITTFAKQQDKFKPEMFQPFDKLQIVTIQQILDGERMNLPLMEEVTKKAQKAKKDDQPTLLS